MSKKTEEIAGNAGNDMGWLSELEARVGEATERIQALRQENRRLATRVAELEEQLEAAEAVEANGGEAPASDNRWTEEREEIRRRVTHLTQTLEELIAEDEEGGE